MVDIDFGHFVRARHALWLDKTYGIPAENFLEPKYLDMLRGYHLTNVWRELDRGTLAVINDLQWPSTTVYQAVWRTLLYRFFNDWSGYNRYMESVKELYEPTVDEIKAIMAQAGNFSGAYIRTIKLDTAIAALKSLPIFADRVSTLLEQHPKLGEPELIEANRKEIRRILGEIPSFGNFLGDQLMLDFSWYGNPWYLTGFKPGLGPGASRGLERLGMTFQQAKTEVEFWLADTPRPRVLISLGDKNYSAIEVPITYVEIEHQLCEAEKLWKLHQARDENEGRKVKMRGYKTGNPRDREAKPLIKPLPNNWVGPHFKKVF